MNDEGFGILIYTGDDAEPQIGVPICDGIPTILMGANATDFFPVYLSPRDSIPG